MKPPTPNQLPNPSFPVLSSWSEFLHAVVDTTWSWRDTRVVSAMVDDLAAPIGSRGMLPTQRRARAGQAWLESRNDPEPVRMVTAALSHTHAPFTARAMLEAIQHPNEASLEHPCERACAALLAIGPCHTNSDLYALVGTTSKNTRRGKAILAFVRAHATHDVSRGEWTWDATRT